MGTKKHKLQLFTFISLPLRYTELRVCDLFAHVFFLTPTCRWLSSTGGWLHVEKMVWAR